MAESFPGGYKTPWEKEKLLVTSNFSFSHGVFKRLILQTRKDNGLFGKGLKAVSLTETKGRTAESAEQDQTACMCGLILLYTYHKNKFMVAR